MPSAARPPEVVRIGTRGSALALVQAEGVRAALAAAHPRVRFVLRAIRTTGDAVTDVPLPKLGGAGVFVAEIRRALLAREVDLAVHSLKDLPTIPEEGLAVAAVLPREDPRDAAVTRGRVRLGELPPGARVGTGSPRRQSQLAAAYPRLSFADLRGNVPTRVKKVEDGELDAVVLAAAGLARLGRLEDAAEVLSPDVLLPAPGQGAVAVETRATDRAIRALVARLHDEATARATAAERALLRALGGGCHLPLGALAEPAG
ncbi:MAG: hydroxymethylbilane synthase, partial [Planctomycetales bacterium]|nr:hydroxymethylbilane synthase [Planctomycetales bacterium]